MSFVFEVKADHCNLEASLYRVRHHLHRAQPAKKVNAQTLRKHTRPSTNKAIIQHKKAKQKTLRKRAENQKQLHPGPDQLPQEKVNPL